MKIAIDENYLLRKEMFMLSLSRIFQTLVILFFFTACNLSLSEESTETPVAVSFNATRTPLAATITSQPTSTRQPTSTPQPNRQNVQQVVNVSPLYSVRQPVPGPVCSIVPTVNTANIRSGPGTSYPVIGLLPANNWLLALNISTQGWHQVSAPGTPVDRAWISSTVIILTQPCVCGTDGCFAVSTQPAPTIQPQPTGIPTDSASCLIYALAPTPPAAFPSYTADIFYEPSSDSTLWGRLGVDVNGIRLAGRTNDGWYAVGPLNGQAGTLGIYTLRWVRANAQVVLVGGACGSLPLIDISYPPPGNCTVTPSGSASVNVFQIHAFYGSTITQLNSGMTLSVVGKTPANYYDSAAGWYAVEPGIVTIRPGSVGKYALGWIPDDGSVVANGNCAALPTVTLDW